MKPTTVSDAVKRFCPFTIGPGGPADKCMTGLCMAWRVVHPEARREDHSGARDFMLPEAVKTNRIMRREGGPGSSGFLVLDEVGVCARLAAET